MTTGLFAHFKAMLADLAPELEAPEHEHRFVFLLPDQVLTVATVDLLRRVMEPETSRIG